MPKKLFVTLLLSIPFAACADSGRSLVIAEGPAAPINEPDTRVIDPSANENTGGEPGGLPVNSGGTTGGASTGGGTAGAGSAPGPGGPSGGAGGNQVGSPVPEPGTLLLFGSGLAGLAGFSLRRRRREKA